MKLAEKVNSLLEEIKVPKEVKPMDKKQYIAVIRKLDKLGDSAGNYLKSMYSGVPGYFQPLMRKHVEGKVNEARPHGQPLRSFVIKKASGEFLGVGGKWVKDIKKAMQSHNDNNLQDKIDKMKLKGAGVVTYSSQLSEAKDLRSALSQLDLDGKQKKLLKDGIDGEVKLSPKDIKEFSALVKKIQSHVKYSTDGIGLQDIRKAL
jgi:hypothetical protein